MSVPDTSRTSTPAQESLERTRPGWLYDEEIAGRALRTPVLEPAYGERAAPARRLLVAGLGNVFLGDDGFGAEVVRELGRRPRRPGLDLADFGTHGMELVDALHDPYDGVVLVEALPHRREPAGTLVLMAPRLPLPGGTAAGEIALDTEALDPLRVLAFAHRHGPVPAVAMVVGCVPAHRPSAGVHPATAAAEMTVGLSDPVRAAVPEAADLVQSLAELFLTAGCFGRPLLPATGDAGAEAASETRREG